MFCRQCLVFSDFRNVARRGRVSFPFHVYSIRWETTRPLAKYERQIKNYRIKKQTNKTIIMKNRQISKNKVTVKRVWFQTDKTEIKKYPKQRDKQSVKKKRYRKNEKNARTTVQSEILISVDFMLEIVRDKFEISSIYGCSAREQKQFQFYLWFGCVLPSISNKVIFCNSSKNERISKRTKSANKKSRTVATIHRQQYFATETFNGSKHAIQQIISLVFFSAVAFVFIYWIFAVDLFFSIRCLKTPLPSLQRIYSLRYPLGISFVFPVNFLFVLFHSCNISNGLKNIRYNPWANIHSICTINVKIVIPFILLQWCLSQIKEKVCEMSFCLRNLFK